MNILEVEQGNVIHVSDNETTFFTVFTLSASSVGMALCGASLILLALTAVLFAEWRDNYKNQLLIQLMLARFIYTSVRYVYDIRNYFKLTVTTEYVIYLDHFFMVYTELALVSWMVIYSRQMYQSLVKVFDGNQSNIWKVTLIAWLVPCIIALLINLSFYLQKNSNFTAFFLYLLIIKWPVLIFNGVLLIRILKSFLGNKATNNFKTITMMIILIFVFCFQQLLIDAYKILYILYIYKVLYATNILIASHIYVLYQCAAAILFWVFGNAKTRKMWKNAILCKAPLMKTQLSLRTSS